jgi:hypothetical protein
MIYDRSKSFPILDQGHCILPSEALLASMEVKSKLTAQQMQASIEGAQKLRRLKPFRKPLAKRSSKVMERRQARYFHSIFAYDTDLSDVNWARNELNRYLQNKKPDAEIDMIYVLNRGIIHCETGRCLLEDAGTGRALVAFYFSILHFLLREGSRRETPPFDLYATEIYRNWRKI